MKLSQLIRFKGENFHSNKIKVTLTLDETLVRLAKAADINLSSTLENILHAFIDGGEVIRKQPFDAKARAKKGWETRRKKAEAEELRVKNEEFPPYPAGPQQ